MRAFRWSTPAAVGLAVSLLFLPGLLLPARAAIIASSEPVTAVIATSHFEEPLVAVGPSSPAEDEALKQALNSYQQRSQPGDRSSIETFLSQNPHSMWAPALWTNLGLSYLHDGFFSRAIDAWQKAWLTGKLATDPRAKALVDRAIGELAQLYANLGRNEQLAALFEEVGQRPITGSATEAFQNAREELDLTAKDPRHLFICGPLALKQLMLARNVSPEKVDFLQWYRAGSTGTSLAEVGRLADKASLAHRLILRQPGASCPCAVDRPLEGWTLRGDRWSGERPVSCQGLGVLGV
ncbi:tetratricopeptide (TPR) repeat protein [Mesorhizobium shonense]|uniref:Tetratricopeptide (TPR) repeat protein n=1 Tax=Mesorhizobium shonense TaxID=1209948 RepID=A0ABV2HKJ4_9HYPH